MSLTTKNPLRMLGGNASSGNPYTGEVPVTRGGMLTASIFSGLISGTFTGAAPGAVLGGSDVLFFSGAGRLNTIIPHTAISGAAVLFYDAASVVSGGPHTSGCFRVIGLLPANTFDPFMGAGPKPIAVDAPFLSGLAAGVRSGCAGFTVCYTPEVTPALPST